MFNLSSFLEKFKHLKNPKDNKIAIVSLITKVAGVSISDKDISINNQTIFLQGSSLLKNRIFLNKEEILKRIQTDLPDLHIKEIL